MTDEKQKKKRGRPPKIKEVTPELLKKIESLAGAFFTQEEIALALDMHENTFYKLAANDPRINVAYKKGRDAVKKQAVFTLRQAMQEGDIGAACFLLKTKFGFREKGKADETAKTEDTAKQMLELANILKEAYKK